jgi:cell division septation protein DedD
MSTSQFAADPGLADPQPDLVPSPSEGASRHLKGVRIGFAATVTIGLALASWYVGVRIVDAHETVPVSRAVNTPSAAPSTPLAAPSKQLAAPSKEEVARAEAIRHTAPPPPDLYLQVAGLGLREDSIFVKGLEAKGYRAHIQGVANQEGSRILIGPFVGRRSLDAAARKLQSAGVLAIETAH